MASILSRPQCVNSVTSGRPPWHPGDAYIFAQTRSSAFWCQAIIWTNAGLLYPWEQISVKSWIKIHFISKPLNKKNCVWNYGMQSGGHFVCASMYITLALKLNTDKARFRSPVACKHAIYKLMIFRYCESGTDCDATKCRLLFPASGPSLTWTPPLLPPSPLQRTPSHGVVVVSVKDPADILLIEPAEALALT